MCQCHWLCCLRLWFLSVDTQWCSSTQWFQLGGAVDSESYYISHQGGPGRPASQMKRKTSKERKCFAKARSQISWSTGQDSTYLKILFSESHSFIRNIIWISSVLHLIVKHDSKHHRIFSLLPLDSFGLLRGKCTPHPTPTPKSPSLHLVKQLFSPHRYLEILLGRFFWLTLSKRKIKVDTTKSQM